MAMGSNSLDQMEAEIEAEFLDEIRDVVAQLEVMIGNRESGLVGGGQALALLRKSFFSLDVKAQSLENACLGIVAHRALEYLSDLEELPRERVPDVQAFLDVIRKTLEKSGADTADLVRQLPMRPLGGFTVAEAVKSMNIEILLVIPDRATGRYVERDLAACGYRVSNAHGFFKGLEQAVRIQPDLVLATALLDEASGTDLARALAGITATAKIPFALLTSFAADHSSLADVPKSVAIVRKGANFSEDIANALSQFKIA